ncbi:MAG: hypothetical protein K8S27_16325 [Candidatus Omnitrophica bacterium]|nr:hypothetical protein [Candidatus Omnitrophota bacterium]
MNFLKTAKDKKESIIYTVLTIVLMESVRIKCNRIENHGKKNNLTTLQITKRQNKFIFKASLLYSLLLLLPTSNYISNSIQKLFSNVEVHFFKSFWFPVLILIISEVFLSIIILSLLKLYVEKMNKALGFFKKIGRSVWDGSKLVVSEVVTKPVSGAIQKTKTGVDSLGKNIGGGAKFIFSPIKKLFEATATSFKKIKSLFKKNKSQREEQSRRNANLS